MKVVKNAFAISSVLLETLLLVLVLCESIVLLGAVVSRFAMRSSLDMAPWAESKTPINIFVNFVQDIGLLGVFLPLMSYWNIIIPALIMALFAITVKYKGQHPYPKRILGLCFVYGVFWIPAVVGMLAYSM